MTLTIKRIRMSKDTNWPYNWTCSDFVLESCFRLEHYFLLEDYSVLEICISDRPPKHQQYYKAVKKGDRHVTMRFPGYYLQLFATTYIDQLIELPPVALAEKFLSGISYWWIELVEDLSH